MAINLKFIPSSFLVLICFTGRIISENPCGDWEAYKDEKCLKIFESPGLVSYQDAENFCKQQDESKLISIGFEEKQKFIQTFLTSNNIVDNVWIGLKYVGNTYQWSDGTELHYTNWAAGGSKKNSSFCAQIETETTNFGYWADVLCSKKNVIICEKIQLWSLKQLQTTVMNIIQNPLPVDFIYVQLPKQKSPTEIWQWMEWKDVTSEYAGVFFRALGGGSAAFGEVQEDASPRLSKMKLLKTSSWADLIEVKADGEFSSSIHVNGVSMEWGLQVMVSETEVRPRNMAVKIWQRIK